MSRRYFFVLAGLAASVGGLVFACGSSDGGAPDAGSVPVACEGSTCDAGAPESSVTDAPADDGARADVSVDAAGDTSPDAGPCVLAAAPDAGPSGTVQWARNFGLSGGMSPTAVAIAPTTGDIVAVGGIQPVGATPGSVDFGGGLLTSTAGPTAYDTFVARFTSTGAYRWAKLFGNGTLVGANGVAVDSSGNVAVGGSFQGTVDFGGGPLTAVGDVDAFLVEFDAGGTHRWSKSFGVAGESQNLNAVRVDPAGNVLIGGIARGALNVGGAALSGYYIAKFGATGTHAWSKGFPAGSTTSSPQIAVDPLGNVLLAGSFSGTANFGGTTLRSGVSADAFVAKYDSSGTYEWAKQFSATDAPDGIPQAAAFAVGTDTCGNIFIPGVFYGKINFGTGAMTAVPDVSNNFLAKFDSTGNCLWSRQFDGSKASSLGTRGVAVTGAGEPVIEFGLNGSVNLGGGLLTSVGQTSMTMGRFTPSGAYRWAHTGGAPSTAGFSGAGGPHGIAASSTSIVVVGKFGSAGRTLALAGTTLTSATLADMFLISLTP